MPKKAEQLEGEVIPAERRCCAIGLHPQRVLAWSSFPSDATRFTF